MISTIQNGFMKKIEMHKSIWNIDFIALDHKSAMGNQLVKELAVSTD